MSTLKVSAIRKLKRLLLRFVIEGSAIKIMSALKASDWILKLLHASA